MSDYERGDLRLHGELILKVAEILEVSANELLGLDTKAAPKKRGPQSQLEKQMAAIAPTLERCTTPIHISVLYSLKKEVMKRVA